VPLPRAIGDRSGDQPARAICEKSLDSTDEGAGRVRKSVRTPDASCARHFKPSSETESPLLKGLQSPMITFRIETKTAVAETQHVACHQLD